MLERLARPHVPADENAISVLCSAQEEMRRVDEELRKKGRLRFDYLVWDVLFWDAPVGKLPEDQLRCYSRALQLIHRAVEKPHYVQAKPMNLATMWLLLTAEALVHAKGARVDAAAESVECMLHLALLASKDPAQQASGARLAEWAILTLEKVLRLVRLSDVTLRRLAEAMKALDFPRLATEVHVVRRAQAYREACRWRHSGREIHNDEVCPPRPEPTFLVRFLYTRDEAFLLRTLTGVVEASRLPPHEAAQRMLASSNKINSLWESNRSKRPLRGPFSWYFLFMWARPELHIYRTWARRDAAVVALSCELHRSKHGNYPEKVDALVPEFLPKLPPDPFTDKPFIYRKRADGQGFIVYSVGVNLKDDGGVKDEKSGKDDIAWEGGPPRGE